MQHPDESTHAKNTARLLTLSIQNSDIYVGEDPADFAEVAHKVEDDPKQFWVIFPNSQSQPIETWSIPLNFTLPKNLILLDGTWRKAKKMWILNPWLHDLPSWHFQQPPKNQYRMRKTSMEYSLSTLEAAAYSLNCLSKFDSTNLLTLLNAMQSQIERFRPDKDKA